ncbi:MAG: GHKL domain-containing protein [Lachnospiraceae bacterium]|nr:GHKL domain-containing protein [Lachnospiraceae bacterium]
MILNITAIITDLIHIIKIILLCELLFVFEKQRDSRRYIIVCLVSVLISQIVYCRGTDVLSLILYMGLIFIVLYTIYYIKLWLAMLLTIGLMFLTSMIDTMNRVMIDLIFDICRISGFIFKDLIESIVSLFLVFALLYIYIRKYHRRFRCINVRNSVFFTILLVIDTVIAMAIVSVYQNGMKEENKYIFAIMAIFVIIGMLFQLGTVFLLYSANSVYAENDALMKKYLNDQKKHYEYLEMREEETKKFRHDVRNHMQMLYYLQQKGEYEEFDKYLELINFRIEEFGNSLTVNNSIVDAIINKFYTEAMTKGINLRVKGKLPAICNIDAYDLCTVFSNVLSNAVEAVEKIENKEIFIECRYTDEEIIVIERNMFKNIGQFKGNELFTIKEDKERHGFGINNIKDAVKRNDGIVNIEVDKEQFCISIMMKNKGL